MDRFFVCSLRSLVYSLIRRQVIVELPIGRWIARPRRIIFLLGFWFIFLWMLFLIEPNEPVLPKTKYTGERFEFTQIQVEMYHGLVSWQKESGTLTHLRSNSSKAHYEEEEAPWEDKQNTQQDHASKEEERCQKRIPPREEIKCRTPNAQANFQTLEPRRNVFRNLRHDGALVFVYANRLIQCKLLC